MPWTAEQMKAKGAHKGHVASSAANSALAYALRTGKKDAEGYAIRVGLSASNKKLRKLKRKGK